MQTDYEVHMRTIRTRVLEVLDSVAAPPPPSPPAASDPPVALVQPRRSVLSQSELQMLVEREVLRQSERVAYLLALVANRDFDAASAIVRKMFRGKVETSAASTGDPRTPQKRGGVLTHQEEETPIKSVVPPPSLKRGSIDGLTAQETPKKKRV